MVTDVAKYYGFSTLGKFRTWLQALPKPLKLYYHDSNGELRHSRPAILLKRLQ